MIHDRKMTTALLGLALGSWTAPARSLAAPIQGEDSPASPENPAASRVPGLAIWIEPTIPEGDRIRGWVEERGWQVLRRHQPPLEPTDLIHVAVKGGPYDYQIHIALLRNKRLLSNQPDMFACECGSDEMLDQMGDAIGAGAERLTQAAAEEREAEATARQEQESPLEAALTIAPVDDYRLTPLGFVGIGVSALGAGVLAGGIILALRPDEIRGNPGTLERYSTHPPGVAMAVGGTVALAAGLALLAIDLTQHRKHEVAVLPALGPRRAGLSMLLRF